jgi:biopolymer transport protein ExbB
MDNIVVEYFNKGGWIMWPILLTSIVALAVIAERAVWWVLEGWRREPDKLDQIYGALTNGDIRNAISYAKGSRDPLVRLIWRGLENSRTAKDPVGAAEIALQIATNKELERASRSLVVLDTVVTLAPLLGLLGTVTGLIRAFFKLGDVELSEQAIGGGIAEALIATASGLVIAVLALVALNFFSTRLTKFHFELQNTALHTELLINQSQLSHHAKQQTETPDYETSLATATS